MAIMDRQRGINNQRSQQNEFKRVEIISAANSGYACIALNLSDFRLSNTGKTSQEDTLQFLYLYTTVGYYRSKWPHLEVILCLTRYQLVHAI